MKKILVFSLNYYPTFVGGAEVAIKEITDRIPSNEIEFHMVTLRFDSNLPRISKEGNVFVHRIGFGKPSPSIFDLKRFPLNLNKFYFQFAAVFKAFSLHKAHRYDCVWAMMAHSSGVPAAVFKMVHPKVPFLLTLQEGDPLEHVEKVMRPLWPLFTRAFTSADRVQAISTFLGNWARRRGFTGPLSIVPNAVDTGHFSQTYSSEELDRLRQKLGKKEGDVFLVTTSRLVHKNAVDDVIRALELLPKHVRFLVLGIGPDEMKLRQLAKDMGVAERVFFLGQISHVDMPKYLKISVIFIRPSRSEGMGNSFVEAMAAGLPVIATQEGGIADFLFDAKRNPDKETTGWAVDVNNPKQIAAVVGEILEGGAAVDSTIRNAKQLAFRKYDWDLVAGQMREEVFGRMF